MADLSQESTEWGRPRSPHAGARTPVFSAAGAPRGRRTINKQHPGLGRLPTRRLLCGVCLGALLLENCREVFPRFFFLRNRHLSCFHVSLAIRGDLRREPRRGGDAVPGQLQRVRPPSRAVAVRIHAGDLGGRQVPGGEEERLNKSATASR